MMMWRKKRRLFHTIKTFSLRDYVLIPIWVMYACISWTLPSNKRTYVRRPSDQKLAAP